MKFNHLNSHSKRQGDTETPAPRSRLDLNRHHFIGYIGDLIYTPELDYLPLISRSIHPCLTSSNLLAQFAAARAGYGLCVLPCFMADTEPMLQRVVPGEVALQRSFWLIVHADMRNQARVALIADIISREVRAARSTFLPMADNSSQPNVER